jgi:hypothetical protein
MQTMKEIDVPIEDEEAKGALPRWMYIRFVFTT